MSRKRLDASLKDFLSSQTITHFALEGLFQTFSYGTCGGETAAKRPAFDRPFFILKPPFPVQKIKQIAEYPRIFIEQKTNFDELHFKIWLVV
jgi:hypothetical protein